MTPFAEALQRAGLRQADFRRLVHSLTGHWYDRGTVSRWSRGARPADPCALAAVELYIMLRPPDRSA